ncbi:hypothetical protein [Aerococcus tenax]|nr:hypothetical protein [Aerococcus tenax]
MTTDQFEQLIEIMKNIESTLGSVNYQDIIISLFGTFIAFISGSVSVK